MDNLISLFEDLRHKYQSLELDILWDKIGDWQIRIVHCDSNTVIFEEDYYNLDYIASRAFIALADWWHKKED